MMLVLSGLFLFSLFATLLAGTAAPVYVQWTGGLPLWPIVLPFAVMGGTAAWLIRRYVKRFWGDKCSAILVVLSAMVAFSAFGDTANDVNVWRLLALKIGLEYSTWHQFVFGEAVQWFGWVAFIIPFLWVSIMKPRARLSTFSGACCGMILARIFSGILSPVGIYDVALAGVLLSATLLLFAFCKGRIAQSVTVILAILLLGGWYFGSQRATEELLQEVHPFAPIAARDGVYTGEKLEGFRFKDGRVVWTDGLDIASRTASHLLPSLFFPSATARIAIRAQDGVALNPVAQTGPLKGQYQAIWVELPPAWTAEERDYYGRSALQTALEHLTNDGILIYENDAHALDARMLMERIKVLQKHFSEVQLWMTDRNHWQLVASRVPLSIDTAALSVLLDRPEMEATFAKANLETPLHLLPCCFVAETKRLEEFLSEPIKATICRGSAGMARQLLFDGVGGKRLEEAFRPYYDMEMPWVKVPDAIASEMRMVLSGLRSARILALQGEYVQASQANPTDPYLQSLADRECFTARSFEQMAEHDKALKLYATAFTIARPRVADVLEAAKIAQTSGDLQRAAPFYSLAVSLAPTSPDVLMAQAQWQFDATNYAAAEKSARDALANIERPELYPDETASVMFFISRAVACQPNRSEEGLSLARAVILSTETAELKARFVPLYGQMLIEAGKPVLGVRVKRHWEAYRELLPVSQDLSAGADQ